MQNANTLTETKKVTLKLKTNDMKNDARDDATNRPASLNNEATPDAALFIGTAPASNAGAIACDITGANSGGSLL